MRKVHAAALLAIILPLSLTIYWHQSNFGYPCWDEASYFNAAQKIQTAYESDGAAAAIRTAYFERVGKGYLHPVFAALPLIATSGNVLTSQAVTITFFFLVYLTYTLLLFRLYLTPWRSMLATLIIGFTCGVAESSYNFNSELPMMGCAAAAAYHLLRFLRSTKKTPHQLVLFGIWLGLGVCVRPVEIFLIFMPAVVMLLYYGRRHDLLRTRDIVTVLVYFLLFAGYVGYCWVTRSQPEPGTGRIFVTWFLVVLAPLALTYSLERKLHLSSLAVSPLVAYYLIAASWYLYGLNGFIEWTHLATFGKDAIERESRKGISYFGFLLNVAREIGGIPLLILSLTALPGFSKRGLQIVAVAIAAAIIHPLVGGLTINGDTRYYALSGLILYSLALVFTLKPSGRLPRMRAGIASTLLLLLITYNVGAMTADTRFRNELFIEKIKFVQTKWRHFPEPPLRTIDPTLHLVKQLETFIPKDRPYKVGFDLESLQHISSKYRIGPRAPWLNFGDRLVDRHVLRIVQTERRNDWVFLVEKENEMLPPDILVKASEPKRQSDFLLNDSRVELTSDLPGYRKRGIFYAHDRLHNEFGLITRFTVYERHGLE